MAGIKHRSGTRRIGAGSQARTDYSRIRPAIDACIDDANWEALIAVVARKAQEGDKLVRCDDN